MATAAHAEQPSMDGAGRTMFGKWELGYFCAPQSCLQPALGVPPDMPVVWILEEEVQGEGEDGRMAIAAPVTQKVFWKGGVICVML